MFNQIERDPTWDAAPWDLSALVEIPAKLQSLDIDHENTCTARF